MANDLTLDLVRDTVLDLADREDVAVVWPDAPQRTALMLGFAAVHHLRAAVKGQDRPTWDVDAARTYTSVTLPGAGALAGPLGALLAGVPFVGALLGELVKTNARDTIYLAPAVLADPSGVALAAAFAHELGHVRQMRKSVHSLAWCLAYGTIDPFRAAQDAPCYGQSLQVFTAFGASVKEKAARYRQTLPAYDLAGDDLALGEALITIAERSLDQDPPGLLGGPSLDLLRALERRGVALPFELPPRSP